jgi:hypothetical protein
MEKFSFDWIDDLLANLPETVKVRRNFIEIAGFPEWENVISNFLAFYFDESEEHLFQRLFLDTLVELIKEKLKIPQPFLEELSGEYSVEREPDYIDILISSNLDEDENGIMDWAIIIENKIRADLYNNLNKYWNSVKADYKVGVILSLFDLTQKPAFSRINASAERFVNILHSDFISRIRQNLALYFEGTDDRHLLFLKDFSANIDAMYTYEKKQPQMENKLKQFQAHADHLKLLYQLDRELLIFVSRELFSVMSALGFPAYSNKMSSRTKHFYPDKEFLARPLINGQKGVRFWITINQLQMNNRLFGYFELHSNFTKYGSMLKKVLQQYNFENDHIRFDNAGSDKGSYNHIYSFDYDLSVLDDSFSLKEKLVKCLKMDFFKEGRNIVDQTLMELSNLIDANQIQE